MNETKEGIIHNIRNDIEETHRRIMFDLNRELVMLYWRIGRRLMDGEARSPASLSALRAVVDEELKDKHLGEYLSLHPQNLKAMFTLARDYPDETFVYDVFSLISWESTVLLLERVQDKLARHWYICQAIESRWSKDELERALEIGMYETRQLFSKESSGFGLIG